MYTAFINCLIVILKILVFLKRAFTGDVFGELEIVKEG